MREREDSHGWFTRESEEGGGGRCGQWGLLLLLIFSDPVWFILLWHRVAST